MDEEDAWRGIEWGIRRLREPRGTRDIVYVLLSCIPPGYTVVYSVLAELSGTSPRAVGVFMRSNRALVAIPCHRVVSKNGLGGFSRGVELKRRLLELEGGAVRRITRAEEYWRVLDEEGEAVVVE